MSPQPGTSPVTSEEPTKALTPLEQIQKQLDDLLSKQKPGSVTATEPDATTSSGVLLSNIFVDEQLIDALQSIAAQANVTIIPDETIVGTVSCTLPNVPIETALDIVLGGTPYVWKKTPYYYLVASSGLQDSMFAKMSETRRVKMNYVTAEAAVGLLSTAFKPYVQAEIGPPGVDTYLVAITAPPTLMERIVADLEKIDRVRKQILLDARIVTMERGNLLNLGVSWTWPTISAGLFSSNLKGDASGLGLLDLGGATASGFSIGYTPDSTFTNALTATLNLLATNDEATIIANPQVLAQDGKLAEISVMTEEYYFMTGNTNQTVGFYNYYSELEKVESGTKLNITPHIGDNDEITLAMVIEVSDSIASGRESGLPVVTRRTSSNTVRIKDGGTVALAGLTENRTRTEKRRTPGLSKLPIIGGLFKNTSDEGASREIAVFVTAHLIPEPGRNIDFVEPTASSIQQPTGANSLGGSFGGQYRQSSIPQSSLTPARPMENDFRSQLRRSLSQPLR
jgi:type II secretory pathway component GspD/PulD (secretin)